MNMYYVVGTSSSGVYFLMGEMENMRVVGQMRIIVVEKNKVSDGVTY